MPKCVTWLLLSYEVELKLCNDKTQPGLQAKKPWEGWYAAGLPDGSLPMFHKFLRKRGKTCSKYFWKIVSEKHKK